MDFWASVDAEGNIKALWVREGSYSHHLLPLPVFVCFFQSRHLCKRLGEPPGQSIQRILSFSPSFISLDSSLLDVSESWRLFSLFGGGMVWSSTLRFYKYACMNKSESVYAQNWKQALWFQKGLRSNKWLGKVNQREVFTVKYHYAFLGCYYYK